MSKKTAKDYKRIKIVRAVLPYLTRLRLNASLAMCGSKKIMISAEEFIEYVKGLYKNRSF